MATTTFAADHAFARARLSRTAVAGIAAVSAFAVAAFAPQVLNDGDTYLHIVAGLKMLADQAILTRDPFSYTFAGAPWQAHEWLAEILMAALWRWAGWGGLLALFGAAAALAAYVLSDTLGRFLEPKAQALTTLMALSCTTGSLLARPHLLALPLLALWMAELVAARAERRAPRWMFALVMCVWANIHASFLLGLALAGAMALEALIEAPKLRTLKSWSIFGLASLGAALVNPHFAEGVIFPFRLMAMPALANIGEWQAAPVSLLQPIVPVSLAALYIIATRRVRIAPVRALTVAAVLTLAFLHARHQMVAAIVAPLLLAEPLSRVAPRAAGQAGGARAVAGAAVALIALLALRIALPALPGDSPVAPNTALAHVPDALRATHVLNDYAFGGYLIYAGVRPFIDSRAELYGESALETYAALIRPDRATLLSVLARNDIRWTILPPASPLAAEMDRMPGWRRLYADRYAIVQFRDDRAGSRPR